MSARVGNLAVTDELFKAVRESSTAGVWSQGVRLSRADTVVFSRRNEASGELEFQIQPSTKTGQGDPDRAAAVKVYLYPEDEDWSCDCPSTADACMHVAAAVIALRQKGISIFDQSNKYQVAYTLYCEGENLALRRFAQPMGAVEGQSSPGVATEEGEFIDTNLAAWSSPGIELVVTDADLQFERTLAGRYSPGALAQKTLGQTLAAFIRLELGALYFWTAGPTRSTKNAKLTEAKKTARSGAPHASGASNKSGAAHLVPCKALPPRAGLQVVVEDCGGDFRVHLEPDQETRAVYANGALRLRQGVAPMQSHGLGRRQYDELKAGQIWPAEKVGALVGEFLPMLGKTMPVRVRSEKLPSTRAHAPRVELRSERHAQTLDELGRPRPGLKVSAVIVYGDPAVAVVDGDTLRSLGSGALPLRDRGREKWLHKITQESYGLRLGSSEFFDTDEAVRFNRDLDQTAGEKAEDKATQDNPSSVLRWVERAHEDFVVADALAPQLELEGAAGFDFFFATAGGERVSSAAVMHAYEAGEPWLMLDRGGLAPLPGEWLAAHGHRVAHLLAARSASDKGPAAPAAAWQAYDSAMLATSLGVSIPAELQRLLALGSFETETDTDEEGEQPADLQADLRDYQKIGVRWLRSLERLGCGALLADDMGLGKTLQTLCLVQGTTLVVVPTSVLQNWQREAHRFRPGVDVQLYHGPSRSLPAAVVSSKQVAEADGDGLSKAAAAMEAGRPLLVLTTYAIVRLDIDELAQRQWDLIVLDEAQAIKNATSQVSRAVFRLQGRARIALSGTPVENRLEDLWCLFHFLNRGLLGGLSYFQEHYSRPIVAGEAAAARRLQERIRPFVLRRLKTEVAKELPPRTEVVRHCALSPEERKVYDSLRAAAQTDVVEKLTGDGGNALQMLEALLRLRQAACHAALVPGHETMASVASSKVALLLDMLQTIVAEGHKALVFSQWTSLLDLIQPHLRAADIGFNRIDGATRDRLGVVDTFQDPAGPPVMLISLKAGGTGLNLTAADHVFLVDPWWNPAVEAQAADRAHRIGQTRPVVVHRLVSRDTVEEAVLELQEKKRNLADAALGDASTAYRLTREEMLQLLR